MVAQLRRDQDTRTATELEVVLLARAARAIGAAAGHGQTCLAVAAGHPGCGGHGRPGPSWLRRVHDVNRINVSSHIATDNPLVLFQDVATNGPRVGSTRRDQQPRDVSRALEQFVLDGTGVCLGSCCVVAGLFVRANL